METVIHETEGIERMNQAGGMRLRPYQEECLQAISKGLKRCKTGIVVLPTSAGKCVTPETHVWSRGLRTFGECWGQDRISGPWGEAEVEGWYDDGFREGLRLKTSAGWTIDGTHAHRLWVRRLNGDRCGTESWVNIGDIRPDDYIGLSRGHADWGDTQIRTDEAYALGLLVADGCIVEGSSQRLQVDKQRSLLETQMSVFERWRQLAGGRSDGKVRVKDMSDYHAVLVVHAPNFRRMLQDCYEMDLPYCEHRLIPGKILHGTRQTVVAFLRGYFDGDGYIDGGLPSVSTASEALADQVGQLMLGLGIFVSKHRKETSHLPSFIIRVHDIYAFAEIIGFRDYGLKKDIMWRALEKQDHNTNLDVVPGVGHLIRALAQRVKSKHRRSDAWRHACAYYDGDLAQTRMPSYAMLRELLAGAPECAETKPLQSIVDEHRIWTKVENIVPSLAHRIDCQVAKQHAFVGNGIINHNTVIFGHLRSHLGLMGKILVLAHRKELLTQAKAKIERIDSSLWVDIERAEHEASDLANVIVASVATLGRAVQPGERDRLARWVPSEFSLIIIDECFPAGTLVDGVPIEKRVVGDLVQSMEGNIVHKSAVVRTFKSVPKAMVKIHLSDGSSLGCTPGHPWFSVQENNYVAAISLRVGEHVVKKGRHETTNLRGLPNGIYAKQLEQPHGPDLLGGMQSSSASRAKKNRGDAMCVVRGGSDMRRQETLLCQEGSGILLGGMHCGLDESGEFQKDGRYEPSHVRGSYENQQPHAQGRCTGTHVVNPSGDRAQTEVAGGQWSWDDEAPALASGSPGRRLVERACNPYEDSEGRGLPYLLQSRFGLPTLPSSGRNRWDGTCGKAEACGSEEEAVFDFPWVVRVEVLEPGSDGTFGGVCRDGFVYNLEVEGSHNYFADGILVHNCHHAPNNTYKRILDYFTGIPVVGFTATPERTDKVGLKAVFKEVWFERNIRQMMTPDPNDPKSPYLARIRGWRVKTKVSLDSIRMKGEDFDEEELAHAVDTAERNALCVQAYKEKLNGKRAVVFGVNVLHCEHLLNAFRAAGIPSAIIVGETKDRVRERVYADLHEGRCLVAINCMVLTEGWDEPRIEGLIMARPTKSPLLYTQCLGRGLRLCDICQVQGCEHKPCLHVVDIADVTKLEIPSAATLMGLPPKWDLQGADLIDAAREADQQGVMASMSEQKANAERIQQRFRELNLLGSRDEMLELQRLSPLRWLILHDKTHYLKIEKDDKINLHEDMLGTWHATHVKKDTVPMALGTWGSKAEALRSVDNFVAETYKYRVKMLAWSAEWRKDPASEGQLVLLRNLKLFRAGLTKGQAQDLIDLGLETSRRQRKAKQAKQAKAKTGGIKIKTQNLHLGGSSQLSLL